MPYLSFEELSQVSSTPTATLNRRLKFIKDSDNDTYLSMLQKQGKVKLYDSDIILGKLAEWKEYVASLEKGPAPPPAASPPVVTVTRRTEKASSAPPPKKDKRSRERATAREKNLNELLQTPVVILAPDPATKRIYDQVRDPLLKERMEYVISICAAYGKGEATIEACCNAEGVAVRTFKEWTYVHPELAALYKRARLKARRARAQELGDAAQAGLMRLVSGEEWDEETTIFQKILNPDGTVTEVPLSSRTTRKRQGPNVAATIFALTNAMSKLYKNRFQHELGPTQDQMKRDEIDKMSPEQRMEQLMEVMKNRMIEQGWTPPQS